MSQQEFFSGFRFQEYAKFDIRLVMGLSPVVKDAPTSAISTLEVKDMESEKNLDNAEDRQLSPPRWNSRQIKQKFKRSLRKMSKVLQQPLPTDDVKIVFVTREDMKPKTEAEKRALVAMYGEYMRDGGSGDCHRNPDNSFRFRIGYRGLERVHEGITVLKTVAHEYGHSLGIRIPDPIFEEMKASTFAQLFMTFAHPNLIDGGLAYTMERLNVHQTAVYRMEQLVCQGITHEQILAQLIGQRFGYAQPDDYKHAIAQYRQLPLF
jgi:hypothetical protein